MLRRVALRPQRRVPTWMQRVRASGPASEGEQKKASAGGEPEAKSARLNLDRELPQKVEEMVPWRLLFTLGAGFIMVVVYVFHFRYRVARDQFMPSRLNKDERSETILDYDPELDAKRRTQAYKEGLIPVSVPFLGSFFNAWGRFRRIPPPDRSDVDPEAPRKQNV
eukprot:Rhum_TRINITY_DN22879_c0_g1::Rhum_TRINITY_DN22879_c0_g1_i1::g.176335::m.176335